MYDNYTVEALEKETGLNPFKDIYEYSTESDYWAIAEVFAPDNNTLSADKSYIFRIVYTGACDDDDRYVFYRNGLYNDLIRNNKIVFTKK